MKIVSCRGGDKVGGILRGGGEGGGERWGMLCIKSEWQWGCDQLEWGAEAGE